MFFPLVNCIFTDIFLTKLDKRFEFIKFKTFFKALNLKLKRLNQTKLNLDN